MNSSFILRFSEQKVKSYIVASSEVGLLNRHIETLLDHRIGVAYVGARSDLSLRTMLVIESSGAFRNEALLGGPEDHASHLKLLMVPGLAHGVRTFGHWL